MVYTMYLPCIASDRAGPQHKQTKQLFGIPWPPRGGGGREGRRGGGRGGGVFSWAIYLLSAAVSVSVRVSVCGMWARMDYRKSLPGPRGQGVLKPKSLREVATSINQKAKGYAPEYRPPPPPPPLPSHNIQGAFESITSLVDIFSEVAKVHTFFTQAEVQVLVEKRSVIKVQVLIQLLYSGKSNKVQARYIHLQ